MQKVAGALRQTQLKVDFDKTAHLSERKIKLRKLKRKILQNKAEIKTDLVTESAVHFLNNIIIYIFLVNFFFRLYQSHHN